MIPKKIWLLVYTLLLVSCSLLPAASLIDPIGPTPTLPVASQTASPMPTETPLPTQMPTATSTPEPTATFTPVPTNTPEPSPTATVFKPKYVLQQGSPAYQRGWVHESLGCNWMGVAGQVFSADGQPVIDVVVVVKGMLGGQPLDLLGVAGAEAAYGPGGYEVKLAGQPLHSDGTLSIQLLGLDGRPQSDPLPFDTSADCNKNLVVINWVAK